MLIKLARHSVKINQNLIKRCVESYSSIFIPIFKNTFGILTDAPEDTKYGKESENEELNFNNKSFVDIYQCLINEEQKKKSFFRNEIRTPYEAILLDNKFFFSIVKLCEKDRIDILYMDYINKYGSEQSTSDLDEIKYLFNSRDNLKVLELKIYLHGSEVSFNKNGYVNITSKIEFYKQNEQIINKLLLTGLED